jgi:hypothetical protein
MAISMFCPATHMRDMAKHDSHKQYGDVNQSFLLRMNLKFNFRFNLNKVFGTNIQIYRQQNLYCLVNCENEVTLEPLTAVTITNAIFLDVMLCNLIKGVL